MHECGERLFGSAGALLQKAVEVPQKVLMPITEAEGSHSIDMLAHYCTEMAAVRG
jgi:hypothetical protein